MTYTVQVLIRKIMNNNRFKFVKCGLLSSLIYSSIFSISIAYAESYRHDLFRTCLSDQPAEEAQPAEECPVPRGNYKREFEAYITVFDGEDNDYGDDEADYLRIPHFVAYEIKPIDFLAKQPPRPSWRTDKELYDRRIAPGDNSYTYSRVFRNNYPNWYIRGHLCMANHAWRLGEKAFNETFTLLNAIPQRAKFNTGLWLSLEELTAKWADVSKQSVWIITGPIFTDRNEPREWIGETAKGEMKVAVPDMLFKIVIQGEPSRPEDIKTLAFVYPQSVNSKENELTDNHEKFLESINTIEEMTGLDFLTALKKDDQEKLESKKAERIW